ncbi:hypothetical protein M433DRAFT_151233 [Acidomyces richmondensis BFW]|nr:MAG: hypothetical protein FE78DRAFT_85107 [Acidomyces sp. 'richmondensis']KYG48309.1 hypothetical protein M433DRAFT_151233 [Acidomyces richmondensis BFW]
MVQLPEEILPLIFSHFRITADPKFRRDNGTKIKTLVNLSLASKTFNRVASCILYSTLDLQDHAQLRMALKTLLCRPKTAILVQNLHLSAWETKSDLEMRNEPSVPAEDHLREQMRNATNSILLPESLRKQLRDGICEGVPDAEVALLLCLCTNLRFLHFITPMSISASLAMKVFQGKSEDQTVQEERLLAHLYEVSVEHWDTEGSTNLAEITCLLQHPTLEIFRGQKLACTEETIFPPHFCFSIKRMYLEWSLVDASGLEKLLMACPNLETLSIHWGGATIGLSRIEYGRMSQSLRNHGEALKTLRLRPENAESFDSNLDTESPLGSLKDLKSLRLLAVPANALLGDANRRQLQPKWLVETLPENLKTLRITDADDDDDEVEAFDVQLVELLRDQRFKELSTIRVNRSTAFTYTEDLEEAGWDEESNKFWVILKRRRDGEAQS